MVCRTGSITKAAAELYISRTVVSHCLRELEEEYNTVLFTRTRTGMELTEAGQLLRDHCRQMRLADSTIRDRLNALNFPDALPQVRLAFTTTTGQRLFPDFFAALRRRCPNVSYTIEEMSAYDTISSVQEGRVDFAVTPVNLTGEPRRETEEIGRIFLHKLESVICVSPEDPLSREPYLTKELIGEKPFITPTTKNPMSFPINITMRTNQIDLIHQVVSAGMAATVLPRDYVRDWTDVVLIPLREPMINDVHLLWNKTLSHSSAFERVLRFVMEYDVSKLAWDR